MQLPHRFLTTVIACGVAGVFVAGCSESPPRPPAPVAEPPIAAEAPRPAGVDRVPAGQELASFRRALSMRGLPTGASDQDTAEYVRTICSEIEAGSPPEQVVIDVQTGTGYSLEDTGYVIGAGIASYCPQNLGKLPQ